MRTRKNHTYKINKIIDLHPYGMNYYYNEESTMFYPSKDGEKYLIYNECRYNSKDQTINAKDDKELKSIVIDLKKDEVTYRKGNHLEKIWRRRKAYPKIKLSKDSKIFKGYEAVCKKEKIWADDKLLFKIRKRQILGNETILWRKYFRRQDF